MMLRKPASASAISTPEALYPSGTLFDRVTPAARIGKSRGCTPATLSYHHAGRRGELRIGDIARVNDPSRLDQQNLRFLVGTGAMRSEEHTSELQSQSK